MGRNATLLGTRPVLVRMSEQLAQALTRLADSEGLSRNTVISRILAERVLELERDEATNSEAHNA